MREEDISIRKRCIDDLGYLIARFDTKKGEKSDATESESMRGSRSNRSSRKNLFAPQK